MAEKEFDILLTTDKGLPHQQHLSRFDLAVVILRAKSNRHEDLSKLMDKANEAFGNTSPGTATFIETEGYEQ